MSNDHGEHMAEHKTTISLRLRWLAAGVLCAGLAACGGSSGDSPAPAPTPTGPDVAARTAAATTTAQSNAACNDIQPFYWELGDKTQKLAGASVDKAGSATHYDADSSLSIASASKWLYGAYVAERRGGVLTAEDVKYLHFQSGYNNFAAIGCQFADTVDSCLARDDNGVQTAGAVDRFSYNGGHMEKHASLPAPGMALGGMNSTALAAELRRVLGSGITLAYSQPQPAGGVISSGRSYAIFLRKLLNNELKMAALLGSEKVCTNPATCATALNTPVPAALSWNYSIGHWVEDDPATGDGAFSSAGAFGFYPWVDASKTWYGLVVRSDGAGGGADSALCGARIRKAWVTGVAQ